MKEVDAEEGMMLLRMKWFGVEVIARITYLDPADVHRSHLEDLNPKEERTKS